jgi:urocanate hydratase
MSSSDSDISSILSRCLPRGLPLSPLPPVSPLDFSVPHAPVRNPKLSPAEFRLAIKNSLRYFPRSLHSILAPEFAAELITYGHIYMYRFRPIEYELKAYPISFYPGNSIQAKCIMLMIMNNLDRAVAQFPHELITYGGNGAVLSNWVAHFTLFLAFHFLVFSNFFSFLFCSRLNIIY